MAQAYTPALRAMRHTSLERLRELPLFGKALVKVGDRVNADTAVLSANLPGELQILRVADRLGLDPLDVISGMKVQVGDVIKRDDIVCEVKTFFGLFTSSFESPVSGTVEFSTEANAHMGIRLPPIPLTVDAYIDGVVTAVEEGKSVTIGADAAFFQGIFGVGGERKGVLRNLRVPANALITSDMFEVVEGDLRGAVLVGGAGFTPEALSRAAELGICGVVTGSLEAPTLSGFVGHEIGVSITGDEEIPFTLIVTEGFGELPLSERITELALELEGRRVSINGATQVRAGAMRPEVIAPIDRQGDVRVSEDEALRLEIDARVRVVRVPYFGQMGRITELPSEREVIPTGASVRVLRVRLDTGKEVTVPRANIELV